MQTKTPASSSSDFIRQRSAVYHGLRQVLTEIEASAALVLWSERFSDGGSVFSGLNNFVHDVCTSYDKVAQQRELTQAISKALILREGELPAAPPMATQENVSPVNVAPLAPPTPQASSAPAVPQATSSAADTPEFQTFKIVIMDILAQVRHFRADLGASCREFLKESVYNMPWSEAQQEQLIQLVDTGNTVQTRAYRPGQLKALMSHLTVWLEENMDSATAARVIGQAITDTGKTAAAKQHAPELFV